MKASIPDSSLLQKAKLKLKRQGAANLLYAAAIKAINAVVPLKVLRGVTIEEPDPAYLAAPKSYVAGFLTEAQLRAYAADPATEMSDAFLDGALAKGDQCYAILDAGKLAAYGWYATTPTPVGAPELQLHFREDYVYMYKGFTDPRYRGQRLHAIGMTRALREYRRRGLRGIVSYVESTNFDSLKSCFRMGYKVFGSIYLARLLGRHFARSSPGCEPYAFRVVIGQYTAPRAATGQSASTTPPRTQTYQS
jgi:ribosomal protein S18 acetylase RimI-like enzyme